MLRFMLSNLTVAALVLAASSASAAPSRTTARASAAPAVAEAKGKTKTAAVTPAAPGKPLLVGTYGDWGAYTSQGAKGKICYALAQPKDRNPAALKRDAAYVFISSRPGEGVRNEVSVIMGYQLKENATDVMADIGGDKYDLVAKGTNAWIRNAAKEGQFIDALKKGSKLTVRAPSVKGNVTVDSYSLAGLSQALDRVQKDCP